MTMKFARKYGAFIFIIILPCVILEVIGLMTLLFPTNDYNDRAATTLSCLMTIATLFSQVRL